MSAIPGRGNRAEVMLRRALWARGLRYRLHGRLPGTPDLVFSPARVALFVDGDFWHARVLREGGDAAFREVIRGPRFQWWREKLSVNGERDERVTALLEADGWKVIRVWESDVLHAVDRIALDVEKVVRLRLKKRAKG